MENTNPAADINKNPEDDMNTEQTSVKFIMQTAFAELLQENFKTASIELAFDEVNINIHKDEYIELLLLLKNDPRLHFEQLMDLCGVDYSELPNKQHQKNIASVPEGGFFCVALQLLSIKNNQRVRVRTYLNKSDLNVPSVVELWSGANWYEREAFDLYGICFIEHPDLRRILTDYDFIGHPLRKDFPVSGFVEMRYDDEQQRVIYQPVTIEPREITPRIHREANYAK